VNKPSITEGVGFINYTWPELGLRVMVERYTEEGIAEMSFFKSNGSCELLLHKTRANLLSTTTMNSLSKRLENNSNSLPWLDVLTYVTGKTIEIARRGEPAEELWPSEDVTLAPDYLCEPLLYLNHPTVIFGDYGSAKSLFALVVATICELPYSDNTLGLTTPEESVPCLYLDYEDDKSSFHKRWSALQAGFGKGPLPILYKRMTATIADSVEQLKKLVISKNIRLLIVDSLGPAARGNLNDPEPAIKYHAALRQLIITSLTLAHCSKDQFTKKRTIFGSVFFTNLARSVWECKADQDTGENETVISLKHTKANLSRLHQPLGYRFNFSEKSISVTKVNLIDTGLSGELPLQIRIKALLGRGPMPTKQISENLEANEHSVRTVLNRMAKKSTIIKVGELWGLKQ
jgi:hypothetical protein